MTDPASTDPTPTCDSSSPSATQSGIRGLLPDLSPWHASRDFRLLWSSRTVTSLGSVLALLALPIQVQRMTGSPVAVGAIGATELVPMLMVGLYGGALADAVDRRRVVLWTELGSGLLAVLLMVNALLDRPRLWPLYAAAAAASGLQGLQQPALSALLPRLVAPPTTCRPRSPSARSAATWPRSRGRASPACYSACSACRRPTGWTR